MQCIGQHKRCAHDLTAKDRYSTTDEVVPPGPRFWLLLRAAVGGQWCGAARCAVHLAIVSLDSEAPTPISRGSPCPLSGVHDPTSPDDRHPSPLAAQLSSSGSSPPSLVLFDDREARFISLGGITPGTMESFQNGDASQSGRRLPGPASQPTRLVKGSRQPSPAHGQQLPTALGNAFPETTVLSSALEMLLYRAQCCSTANRGCWALEFLFHGHPCCVDWSSGRRPPLRVARTVPSVCCRYNAGTYGHALDLGISAW
jgi:hypothetical protein